MSNKEFVDFCVGTVTVITSNNLVITGRVVVSDDKVDRPFKDDKFDKKEKKYCFPPKKEFPKKVLIDGEVEVESEEKFITLHVTAAVFLIPGTGTAPGPVQSYITIGDIIKINQSEIVAVGPSHVVTAAAG